MNNIAIKQVLDDRGAFSHLELWQGDRMIELSLGNASLDVQHASYKWEVLRSIINQLAERVAAQSNNEGENQRIKAIVEGMKDE